MVTENAIHTPSLLGFILCHITNLSAREKLLIAQRCGNAAAFLSMARIDVEKLLERPLNGAAWDKDALKQQAERDVITAKARGIRWVMHGEPRYPPLLREIWDPPVMLFYRGTLPNPEKPLLAIVGTRNPTEAALREAYEIALECGRAGLAVISGLALGIDAMAHRGNIEGGAPTVAVLGSGLDVLYPAGNEALARRIVEQGGVLLSEYPPGMGPEKWHFPARNRIISALSRGTLVVEAPEQSGALITARFALEHGRDLWVGKSSVASERGGGTRKLAKDGVLLVNGAADILSEWGFLGDDAAQGTAQEARCTLQNEKPESGSEIAAELAESLARSLNIVY
jgi:DNA processing protein